MPGWEVRSRSSIKRYSHRKKCRPELWQWLCWQIWELLLNSCFRLHCFTTKLLTPYKNVCFISTPFDYDWNFTFEAKCSCFFAFYTSFSFSGSFLKKTRCHILFRFISPLPTRYVVHYRACYIFAKLIKPYYRQSSNQLCCSWENSAC